MKLLIKISEQVQNGEAEKVKELINEALSCKIPIKKILDNGLIEAMDVVGDKFRVHDIFLPEVLLAARAMQAGLNILEPLLVKSGLPALGKIVIGTVKGDMHDIGKNLVAILLKGAGFKVIDLGNDVSPEKFISTAESERANIIGMSALLTTTMSGMKTVIEQLKANTNLNKKVKIIVGGAAVSKEFANDIGADAYGFDGVNAVQKVKELLG